MNLVINGAESFGSAGGIGTTVAGVSRIPFVVGIDRYLPSAFGKIHPKWKTQFEEQFGLNSATPRFVCSTPLRGFCATEQHS